MIPGTRETNAQNRHHLSFSGVANGGTDSTDTIRSEGVGEIEVLVVASADHNFDVQLQIAGEEGGALHSERSVDASGGADTVSFEATILGFEYRIQITNNDGANTRDYEVYIVEKA